MATTIEPYIIQYKNAIEKGRITIKGEEKRLVVGHTIKQVVDILCSYFDDPSLVFDPRECYKRFDFQQTCCLQGYEPFYKKPIELMLWQQAFWEAIYAFYEKDTNRLLINEALLEVGRKNGKSSMIASDATCDLFIGKGGVNICCASNDDRQAKAIWKECAGMQSRLDTKSEMTSHNLVEIRNNAKNITIMRLSSKTQNKDGFNFIKTYQDEAHDCKNDEIAEACKRSMSTHDESLFITCSTNGFLRGMYFDKKLDYAHKWLNGEIDNKKYLPFLFEQDCEEEVWGNDLDMWQKSNPSLIYGVKKWAYLNGKIEEAKIDKEARIHCLVKEFNIAVTNSKAWLTLDEYDYTQEQFTLDDFRGSFALGSVDLSDVGDLTIAEILLMKPNDATKYVVTQAFIPESKLNDADNGAKYAEWSHTINPQTGEPYVIVIKGNRINQKNVADWFQRLRDNYDIETMMIGFDPWHSDVFLMYCDKKTGYGFNTMKIYQNSKLMSFPMKMVERDLNARLINYGNNPVMKHCFGNISAKIINDSMIMPEKIGGQYSRKIDAVVALIILYATLEKNEVNFEDYVGGAK